MQSPTEALRPVFLARDLLVEFTEEHRKVCKNSDCGEIGNILAYLAHCTGSNEHDLRTMPQRLLHYDMECAGCDSLRHDLERRQRP